MLDWFRRDPISKLQRRYLSKLEEAREMQRGGDAILAAILYDEADDLACKLELLRTEQRAAGV
ncbi:MAG: Lacal_2735 family protein [Deltaproteobacteria bacterium]|nr:Lacal_2735 family protein [Deltaproteobacteria bacterium]